jgi:hypothetical protein
MNQGWEAARANPKAAALVSKRQQGYVILSGVAAEAALSDVQLTAVVHTGLRLLLVEGWRFTGLDGQGAGGADGEAKASSIAQRFIGHSGLAVDNLDSAFGARRHTHSTAVAEVFIDVNNLTFRHCTPFALGQLSSGGLRTCDFGNLLLREALNPRA